jgi:hypothetical protein
VTEFPDLWSLTEVMAWTEGVRERGTEVGIQVGQGAISRRLENITY